VNGYYSLIKKKVIWLQFMFLKFEIPKSILKLSSYLSGNILRVNHKKKSVNV